MSNFASTIKAEIVRLARKEVRSEIDFLRKTSAQHRSEITQLKRQVVALEKQLARVDRKTPKANEEGIDSESTNSRFNAKGFASHRKRLGLSAAEVGLLLGASAQSVYHWESGKTKPRRAQMDAITALRKMGKKEAKAKLALLAEPR